MASKDYHNEACMIKWSTDNCIPNLPGKFILLTRIFNRPFTLNRYNAIFVDNYLIKHVLHLVYIKHLIQTYLYLFIKFKKKVHLVSFAYDIIILSMGRSSPIRWSKYKLFC